MLWFCRILVVLGLYLFVHWQADGFSPDLIGAIPVDAPFFPRYRYLAKGKQCFVFESEDQKRVLKFFNRKYFQEPFYVAFLPAKWAEQEKRKRSLRREIGYEIAFRELGEQIISVSGEQTVYLTDRAGRHFAVDLSKTAFVEQKKGTPFYPSLKSIYEREGEKGLKREIGCFVNHIGRRMAMGIADRDHNVEDNWGYIDGHLFHLDPGRLYKENTLLEPQRLQKEWWSTTHRFRKWLEKNYPDTVTFLDASICKTSQLLISQQSQCSSR